MKNLENLLSHPDIVGRVKLGNKDGTFATTNFNCPIKIWFFTPKSPLEIGLLEFHQHFENNFILIIVLKLNF